VEKPSEHGECFVKNCLIQINAFSYFCRFIVHVGVFLLSDRCNYTQQLRRFLRASPLERNDVEGGYAKAHFHSFQQHGLQNLEPI
jgi:hypothetical protein